MVHISGIGPVEANAVGSVDEGLELEFEHDSDWSGLGDGDPGEDPDSNSEGYYGNDYPEVIASPESKLIGVYSLTVVLSGGWRRWRIFRREGLLECHEGLSWRWSAW